MTPRYRVALTAEAVGKTPRTLEKLKKRFVEQGLEAAIERKCRETPPREIHYAPKHGRWLNIAEMELSALKRQCLARPNPLHGGNAV